VTELRIRVDFKGTGKGKAGRIICGMASQIADAGPTADEVDGEAASGGVAVATFAMAGDPSVLHGMEGPLVTNGVRSSVSHVESEVKAILELLGTKVCIARPLPVVYIARALYALHDHYPLYTLHALCMHCTTITLCVHCTRFVCIARPLPFVYIARPLPFVYIARALYALHDHYPLCTLLTLSVHCSLCLITLSYHFVLSLCLITLSYHFVCTGSRSGRQ
jgi:hypothetical protein